MRAARFELLDEMIELGAQHPILRTRRRIVKTWKQEHVLDAVRLGPSDPLWFLRAVTGERENHKVARTAPGDEAVDGETTDDRSAMASISAVTS